MFRTSLVRRYGGYRQGDLIVKVLVETPSRITRRQRDLLKEFEENGDPRSYPIQQEFREKARRSKE